jgi:hypothetical protein
MTSSPAKGRMSRLNLTAADPVTLVTKHLEARGSRPDFNGNWTCPAHDDHTPSLSVQPGDDGRALVYCHAGCELGDVLAAIDLDPSDLFPRMPTPFGIVTAIYTYTDEHGRPLFQVCRTDTKQFPQRRREGDGWAWGLNGVAPVLYRLPRVLAAVKNGRPVYVVEGEKDVLSLERAGVVATCNPGGAGKWRDGYSAVLTGAEIIVVADRDDPGRKHAATVADSLGRVGCRVRVVQPTVDAPKADATDHLEAGYGVDAFVPLSEHRPVGPAETARLLDQVAAFVRRFVVFQSDAQAVAVALWVLHAHSFKASDTTPYLHVHSAQKRSGKTRLLEVLELLVPRPERAATISAPALFRMIQDDPPTLLLDEVDAIFKGKGDESSEALRAVLNAGFRAGTTVPRVTGQGTSRMVERFLTYCPKVLAGIGRLPDTIGDRCIPIVMQRKKQGERAERFHYRDVAGEASPLRLELSIWADGVTVHLSSSRPELPEDLNDRAADMWEPLFAIADMAGAGWPSTARKAARKLHAVDEDEDTSSILLLRHIREAFTDAGTDYLPTDALLRRLVGRDDGPWAEWWGRDVAADDDSNRIKVPASRLARMLQPFNVKPEQVKREGHKTRGYRARDFADSWDRYLVPPSPPQNDGTTVPRRSGDIFNKTVDFRESAPDQGGTGVPTFSTSEGGTGVRRLRKRVREEQP